MVIFLIQISNRKIMSKCTSINKNDRLFIQPVELCTIKALDHLKTNFRDEIYNKDKNKIFTNNFIKENSDINKDFRGIEDNEFIYEEKKTKKDLCYQVNNKNEWALNCSLEHLHPLYTYDKQTKGCTLIPNLNLPDKFVLNKEKGQTYIYFEPDENNPEYPIYKSQKQKAYCENSWCDWITVPNYHLGNQYEKDSGIYSKRDVKKCYKPCGRGMLPYIKSDGDKICIPKSEAYDGSYVNKLDFSPISLINLIGNSLIREHWQNDNYRLSGTIRDLYCLTIFEKISNYNSEDLKHNINLLVPYNVNNIQESQDWRIFGDYTKGFDLTYELYVNYNLQMLKSLLTNVLIKETIDITEIQNNKEIITYKNPLFHEEEEELFTLRGMSNSNMMSDVILVHSFLLAQGFYKFIIEEIKDINNYYENANNSVDSIIYTKIINHRFNIYNILKEKFNFLINIYNNNEFNKIKQKWNIYNENFKNDEKILLDLRNKFSTEYNNNKLDKYYQRLANILYKSINLCYNDETNFSKNLIIQTKRAFNNINTILKSNINNDTEESAKKLHFYIKFLSKGVNSIYDIENFKIPLENEYRLEIPYIDNPTFFNEDLINYIKSGFNFRDKIKTQQDKDNFFVKIEQNFYNRLENQNVFFYTQEIIEKKRDCIAGQIPNPDKTNLIERCKPCLTICNNYENCSKNKNCSVYCSSEFKKFVTDSSVGIGNNSNNGGKGGKCGSIKDLKNVNKEKSNNNKIYDTPLEENQDMPDFRNLLNICIKIIFMLLSLYICYVFYQIYGETFLTIINLFIYNIAYYILYIFDLLYWLASKLNLYIYNPLHFKRIIADYDLANISSKYKNVVTKVNDLTAEMRAKKS